VGEAGWLRQAIFGCTVEGDFDCIFQQAFIAHGNKNRLDVGACSNYGADDLVLRIAYLVLRIAYIVLRLMFKGFFVFQQSICAFLEWGLVEGAG